MVYCYVFGVLLSFLEALFSGFFQFQGNFVDGKKKSKYRDGEPLKGFIAKTKQVYSIELHIARKRDKLTYDLKKWKKLISVVAN